jgi:hypothetical protein
MKNVIRTAIVATMLGAATLGLAGAATAAPVTAPISAAQQGVALPLSPIMAPAAPLNDPNGLCSYHDAYGNCSVGAGAPSIIIDLTFPANTPQEQSIVDYLNKVLDDFNANTEPGTLDNPRPLQELDATSTTYTSGTPEAGTQTVVVKVSEHLGGLYPLTWYKAFTYNNAAKAPITFDTLFRPGTKPLDAILPIVQQHLSATAGQPMEDGLDAANYQNFAVTNDAVIFFFDQNQMDPGYGGIEVSVPRSAIAKMLNPGI